MDGVNAHFYTVDLQGVTPTYYDTHASTFTARLDWDPVGGQIATQDIALFLTDAQGNQLATSDGDTNREMIAVDNLPGGMYQVIACAFLVVTPQPFNAQVFFNVTRVGGSGPLPNPEDGDRGITFSATTNVDPQRDVAEPSMRI